MLKRISIVFAAVVVLIFAVVFFSGKEPTVRLAKPLTAIGNETPVAVQVDDPHGVKSVSAFLEQNGQRQSVFEDKTKSTQASRVLNFTAGRKQAAFLKEGAASLIVDAKSNDFRGATGTLRQDVQIILRPPTIVPDGAQHYIDQGGAELVTFDVGAGWTDAGVHAGKYTSESFPMPGEPENSEHRFSLFAYPWDLQPSTIPVAFVHNGAGTEVSGSFWTQIKPKQFHSSEIHLKTEQLQKAVGELDPEGSGDLVARFVKINSEMRKANNQTIYDLRLKTENRMLWSGPFIPMKGKRESYFADQRSYEYNGKIIDRQVHLGFDIAQTTNRPVRAANAGKIVYADRLGIYGNCVVIDHGYALQTLYGHLSKIEVKVGDSVQKEQEIGISGMTGMAFGDHVHFSTLVSGWQVEPREWWDEHWLHDRILSKIGSGAGRQTGAATPPPSAGHSASSHAKKGRRRR